MSVYLFLFLWFAPAIVLVSMVFTSIALMKRPSGWEKAKELVVAVTVAAPIALVCGPLCLCLIVTIIRTDVARWNTKRKIEKLKKEVGVG